MNPVSSASGSVPQILNAQAPPLAAMTPRLEPSKGGVGRPPAGIAAGSGGAGGALLGQKNYTDAEPLLLAGYEGMKQPEKTIPPQSKIRIPEAIERLVQFYEAADKKDEAAKWRKTLESLVDKVIGPVHEVGQGLELRGQLDKQTPTLVYQVKLAAGKTYVIDMVSPDQKALDPFLVLTDATGKKLAEHQKSGAGLNAGITFPPPSPAPTTSTRPPSTPASAPSP